MRFKTTSVLSLLFVCLSLAFAPPAQANTLIFNGDLCSEANSEFVRLDVSVENFEEIASFQFTLQWDANVLQFLSTGQFNLPYFSDNNIGFSLTPNGKLMFAWFDNETKGLTYDDGTQIFSLYFKKLSDADPAFQIPNYPTPTEVVANVGGNGNWDFRDFAFNINPTISICAANPDPPVGTSDPVLSAITAQVRPSAVAPGMTSVLFLEGAVALDMQVSVMRADGQIISKQTRRHLPGISRFSLDLPDVPGLYFVQIKNLSGGVRTLKVVVSGR